ncbi:MAG: selenocysteine-specific translation elongation factor [Deltaproteobacteria bacterium]|nr:selenocysteine-specific translation elongation factor [Deltaproteobacteria bacterium]
MPPTKNIILGTAGHVDHGKTAFVKALTGTDCDRLREEKERGITIVLGYARMMLPSGIKVGIVDVPGHERFVSRMVAGAAGIDVVALLIAADEGIKPQTIEHLHICDVLGITRGIVVLNKKDLIDDDLLFLQKEEIADLLEGTSLAGSPIIPVSSVTGEGLGDFIRTLDRIAGEVTVKPIDKPFRLPVDATLTITGFGTVVRGTAISGRMSVGEEVILLPEGRRARVRGMENHGSGVDEGRAGERLALNLPDVSRDEVDPGVVVAREGYYRPSDNILVHFRHLPYNKKPISGNLHCQFHVLTSRIKAELHLLNRDKLLPGEEGFAVVKTARPLIVACGDPFVIRGYGLFTTIGGGCVLHPSLPSGSGISISEGYLQTLRRGSSADKTVLFVRENADKGITPRELTGILNLSDTEVKRLVEDLKQGKILFQDDEARLYHRGPLEFLQKKMLEIVCGYHRQNPLRAGINTEELFIRTETGHGVFHLALHLMIQGGVLCNDRDLIRDGLFNPGVALADPILLKVENLFLAYGLQPATPAETARELNVDLKALREVLNVLIRAKRIIRIQEDFYLHQKNWGLLRESLAQYFAKNDILTPQDLRGLFGLSRKFSIPLLEFLDSRKLTIRTEEGRKLWKEGAL